MNTSQLPYWLAAICLPTITPRKILRWLAHFTAIEDLFQADTPALQAAGLSAPEISVIRQPDWHQVEKELAWANQSSQWIIAYTDPDYPPQLKEIADPPLVLYARGNKAALSQKQIAIVGSRHASVQGLKNAASFAASLAQAGLTITSGLALGIDGAAHQGALSVKGLTIAVCGTGLKYVYPSSHKPLVERILEQNGAVVSEFVLDERPFAANFPRRNRIISGLTLGVLVIEAALKSGSLITARHALECGRDVFAVPGNIHHPLAHGCHHLLRQGAKLVERVEDILDEFRHLDSTVSSIARAESPSSLAPLSPECEQLLNHIDYEVTPMDVIALRSRLTASQISSILLLLELDGYIETVTGGYSRVLKRQS